MKDIFIELLEPIVAASNRYLIYLQSLLRHKYYVFVAGRYVGVSIWQLLIHDLSKLSPVEFRTYARHSSTKEGRESEAFAAAWLHHENHNPHHWGYWIPRSGKFANQPLPMPEKYVREMVADWMGAGRTYTGRWDIAEWLTKNMPSIDEKLHPQTKRVLMDVLLGIGVICSPWSNRFKVTARFLKWSGEYSDLPPLTTYHCPDCGSWSGGMPSTGRLHEVTAEEEAARPNMVFIGHEVLACPCGRELTWFDMEAEQ